MEVYCGKIPLSNVTLSDIIREGLDKGKETNSPEEVSPGDSDYESSHEGIPFKIRKRVAPKAKTNLGPRPLPRIPTAAGTTVDFNKKIQKSIKDYFLDG